ncbi:MAG: hypothetical protein KJO07_17840 [Deltaproteobacteria bacterium]|nr:hypothetical protein [Deltaproteobacteria bacterium]
MKARIASALLCLSLACGTSGPADSPPELPASNDSAYQIGRVGSYYLIGNELTSGQDQLEIEVAAPSGTDNVDFWLGDRKGERMSSLGGGSFGAVIDISELEAGDHQLVLATPGADEAFAVVEFKRTHPLYVVVSTDWDDPDNTNDSLELQETLHARHPELKITHFVGPYTYTDPEVTDERKAFLTDWLLGMRDDFDDEIGLHIHPYCSYVESAGLPCRTGPSTVYDAGDDTGYTVMCSAYEESELVTLFSHADEIFQANGLGKPTSFRAGGWTADLKVLRAMGQTGYVADTSANNWQRMEEWKGQANGELYRWNQENWATIGDTSQPYYPDNDNILQTGPNPIPVLEVPDNGILVDYVTAEEMIEIFEANWPRHQALSQPVNYSIGWHPTNFNREYRDRMDDTMDYLDQYLASSHDGPVVYETLTNMTVVWPQ